MTTNNITTTKKIKNLSASQLNCYKSCPRKYYFQYVKFLKAVTRSDALNAGTEAHDLIAKGIFDHPENDEVDGMLKVAQEYLNNKPHRTSNTALTEHKLYGKICNLNTVGILDKIFPDQGKALDWKSGVNKPYKKIGHDIQSFIYAELFEQNFGKELEELHFVFLGATQDIYSPKIQSDNFRRKVEKNIQGILDSIESKTFDKKRSPLCNWCGYQSICEMFE